MLISDQINLQEFPVLSYLCRNSIAVRYYRTVRYDRLIYQIVCVSWWVNLTFAEYSRFCKEVTVHSYLCYLEVKIWPSNLQEKRPATLTIRWSIWSFVFYHIKKKGYGTIELRDGIFNRDQTVVLINLYDLNCVLLVAYQLCNSVIM